MEPALIVEAVRSAVGKAPRGSLRNLRPDDMAAGVIEGLLLRVPELNPAEVEDVILGCAFPEAEQGMNVARIAALRAGLPVSVPGMTVNRFCASGLQAIAIAAHRIMVGEASTILAGGVESMSRVPMGGNRVLPNPTLIEVYPDSYISMGLGTELLARRYGITREEADSFALRSHQRALRAIGEGRFKDEIVPLKVREGQFRDNKLAVQERTFDTDEGPRPDTSLEALSKLKPVFMEGGQVTAGNSSQTSDGAAVALVMAERKAVELGLAPLGKFLGYAVTAVEPEYFGIGPVAAIKRLLERHGLGLHEIDLIELNEAFAAQALAVIKELKLDPERVNVNGGAIALGHPLGCTGAKLMATLLHELRRRGGRYGIVTMCVGGGMGAAGLFEAQ
jgi:acetyl-CoA acyltransferase